MKIIKNDDITIAMIQANIGAPTVINVNDVPFDATAYFYILKKYHQFIHVMTRYLPIILKSQFEKIIGKSESTTRAEITKLKKMKIIGEKRYKGNMCIYPLYRAFQYAQQHFEDIPGSFKPEVTESVLLTHLMRVEVWLQRGVLLGKIDFLKKIGVNEVGFTREINFEEPDYNWTALNTLIKRYNHEYKNFKKASNVAIKSIDTEVPELKVNEDDYKQFEYQTQFLTFNDELQNAKDQAEQYNTFKNRFKNCKATTQNKFFLEINNAAFQTLINKNCYILSMEIKENKTTIEVAIFYYPDTSAERLDNIISELQFITSHRYHNTVLKPIIITPTEKSQREAYGTYKKALDMRKNRGKIYKNRININRRVSEMKKQLERGIRINSFITDKQIIKHSYQFNKFFNLENIMFLSLKMDNYFSSYSLYEDSSQKFDTSEFIQRKKELAEKFI